MSDRLLARGQWLFISQFGYCVDVTEKRNSMLGFVDTRNKATRQTLMITQHLFCDDTFIAEAHILGLECRQGTRLHLVTKSHNCIDKVKGHLRTQKH